MGLQSKLTVYAAIIGCLGLMAGIVYYASLDNIPLGQVEVELTDVVLREAGESEAKFTLTFLVKNSSEKTFVVPVIEYQLYGDDVLLGSGKYSTEDVALPGRAQIFGGAEVPIKNTFILTKDENLLSPNTSFLFTSYWIQTLLTTASNVDAWIFFLSI